MIDIFLQDFLSKRFISGLNIIIGIRISVFDIIKFNVILINLRENLTKWY